MRPEDGRPSVGNNKIELVRSWGGSVLIVVGTVEVCQGVEEYGK